MQQLTDTHRATALRAALRIMDEIWAITDDEAADVLGATAGEIRAWRAEPGAGPVTDERLTRVSYVLGIHKALDTLVPKRSAHPGFVRRGAPALEGESPLDVMRQGTAGLQRIRRWLDGECGW